MQLSYLQQKRNGNNVFESHLSFRSNTSCACVKIIFPNISMGKNAISETDKSIKERKRFSVDDVY